LSVAGSITHRVGQRLHAEARFCDQMHEKRKLRACHARRFKRPVIDLRHFSADLPESQARASEEVGRGFCFGAGHVTDSTLAAYADILFCAGRQSPGGMVMCRLRETDCSKSSSLRAQYGAHRDHQLQPRFRRLHTFHRPTRPRTDAPSRELVSIIVANHDGTFLEWYRRSDELSGQKLVRAMRGIILTGLTGKLG
jgi:hypothetical protein